MRPESAPHWGVSYGSGMTQGAPDQAFGALRQTGLSSVRLLLVKIAEPDLRGSNGSVKPVAFDRGRKRTDAAQITQLLRP